MLFNAGSGEMIKASLMMHSYAVAICRNNAHKKMVLENLTAFVKSNGIVNLATDAPTKPADLVEFEKQLQMQANTGQASVGVPLLRPLPRAVPPLLQPPPCEAPLGADTAAEPPVGKATRETRSVTEGLNEVSRDLGVNKA